MDRSEQMRETCSPVFWHSSFKGSAFLISPNLAITAAHNFSNVPVDEMSDLDTTPLTLVFEQTEFRAAIERFDKEKGIALLRLSKEVEAIQPLSFSFDAKQGDSAYFYGFSEIFDGAGLTIDARIQEARLHLKDSKSPLLLLSIPANVGSTTLSGMSGAPVFIGDAAVGIVVRCFSEEWEDVGGFVGAIPIQDALELLPTAEYARAKRKARTPSLAEPNKEPTVAVIAALDEELDLLLSLRYNWSGPRPTGEGVTYQLGHMEEGFPIVAASANSMGLIDIAILTTKLIKQWSPRLIGLIGICGGRKSKGLSIGDIVVPTQTFHYQFGAIKDGIFNRELRVENSDKELIAVVNHLRRTGTLAKIRDALPLGFPKPSTDLQCHVGPMASADLVVMDTSKFDEVIEADRKTIAIEMESYAFMKAAALARVRWVLVAKSVSDYADASKGDEFREYAKYTSTSFFIEVARACMLSGLIETSHSSRPVR